MKFGCFATALFILASSAARAGGLADELARADTDATFERNRPLDAFVVPTLGVGYRLRASERRWIASARLDVGRLSSNVSVEARSDWSRAGFEAAGALFKVFETWDTDVSPETGVQETWAVGAGVGGQIVNGSVFETMLVPSVRWMKRNDRWPYWVFVDFSVDLVILREGADNPGLVRPRPMLSVGIPFRVSDF